ncbi:MAG TPA: hypothetical protein VKR26_10025 [Terriglobales bacterium]|nr:hypothetical protein [Terriglobales bacterium]
MRAWVVAVMLAGMGLSAAAQSDTRVESLPAAPEPGSSSPVLPAASAKEAAVAIEPLETAPYTPLTSRQKFHIFVQQTYSFYTVANTAFDAGWAQMTDDWPAYGQGMEGYGKRYGALLANHEAGSFFENFLFPTLLRQDPRYFRMGPGHSLFARMPYAASRVLVTQSDSGRHTFNSSLLLGLLFVDSLTNAYYPRPQRSLGDTMSRFGGGVLSSAETNLLREFMPDMMRLFHRHEPEKLKKLEQLEKKMPLAGKLSPPQDGTVQSPASPAPASAQPKVSAAGKADGSSTPPAPQPPSPGNAPTAPKQ